MATTAEDVLHIHNSHGGFCGGDEVTDQLGPLRLPGVAREPGLHSVEVLASAELHGNAVSLPNSHHHSPLEVLH